MFFRVTINCNLEAIILYWVLENLRMLENTIVKRFWTCSLILVWLRHLEMVDHDKMPAMTAFYFDLAASNLLTEVFCLNYNTFENGRSYFLELGIFPARDKRVNIGIFPVNYSDVETIADPRITL